MSDDNFSQGSSEIYAWAAETLGRKEMGTANRCSSAPKCVRQRFFQNQGIEGEQMQPRSLLVFALGDVVEHVYKYLIAEACVGPTKLYSEVDFGQKNGTFTIQHREFDIYKQEKLEINITANLIITGSPDGWGKRNSDGEWEIIEVKSAAAIGFEDFVKGENDYIKQVHALALSPKAKALGVKSARFFFMNKNTSAIFDRLYEINEETTKQVIREFIVAAGPNEPAIPEDPDIGFQDETYRNKPTGARKLGWKCSYCPYKARCFPDADIQFKNGKPVYYERKKA